MVHVYYFPSFLVFFLVVWHGWAARPLVVTRSWADKAEVPVPKIHHAKFPLKYQVGNMWLPFVAQIATRINFQSAFCKWYVHIMFFFKIDVAIFKCKHLIGFARQLRQSSSTETPRNLKYHELTQYILLIFYSFGPELWSKMMNDEYIIYINIR